MRMKKSKIAATTADCGPTAGDLIKGRLIKPLCRPWVDGALIGMKGDGPERVPVPNASFKNQ